MRKIAVVLIVLFPLLLLVYGYYAFVELAVAIVILYLSATAKAVRNVRSKRPAKARAPQPEWKDPWNTDGVGQ